MKAFIVLAVLVACTAAVPTLGIDADDADWRIVGGSTAVAEQFPFIVSQRAASSASHQCGGSILNTRWILTAAHCLMASGTFTYVAGATQISGGGTRFSVSRRIIHDSFDPNTIANDIGVVELESTISFSNAIQPVFLSSASIGGSVGVTLSGWGRLTAAGIRISNNLQYLHMNTITFADCLNRLRPNPVVDTNICTIMPTGQGACNGDSGGPLVLRDTNIQVGIVSWGIPCGRGFPDVYTRISSYTEWISNSIAS